jgi:hypothetical protein
METLKRVRREYTEEQASQRRHTAENKVQVAKHEFETISLECLDMCRRVVSECDLADIKAQMLKFNQSRETLQDALATFEDINDENR